VRDDGRRGPHITPPSRAASAAGFYTYIGASPPQAGHRLAFTRPYFRVDPDIDRDVRLPHIAPRRSVRTAVGDRRSPCRPIRGGSDPLLRSVSDPRSARPVQPGSNPYPPASPGPKGVNRPHQPSACLLCTASASTTPSRRQTRRAFARHAGRSSGLRIVFDLATPARPTRGPGPSKRDPYC